MESDPLDFLTFDSGKQELSHQEDPLSFLEKSKGSPFRIPKPHEKIDLSRPKKNRNVFADLLTTGTSIAGLPGDLASIFTGDNPLTSKSLRDKGFELLPSLAPQNEQEKAWDEGLSTLMGLAAPGAPVKAAGSLISKGIGKLSGKTLSPILKGKYRELYDIGKNLGIDEKALAPFKHGKVTGGALKTLSKLGEEAKKGIEFAEKLATPKYDQIYEAASKIPLNQITKRGVTKGLENIVKDIQKSPALVKESKDVVTFLEEAIHGIKNNPNVNVENLMALQKQAGKTVNWSSIKQAGKGHLVKEARTAIEKGIYGMNPSLGKQFTDMDRLYAGYKNLAKEVKPSKIYEYASKGGPLGYTLFSILTGHDIQDSVTKGAGIYFGKKSLSKISGKLLTDPKWVGMKEKVINMVKKGSVKELPKILVAMKKKAHKESPQDFKDED